MVEEDVGKILAEFTHSCAAITRILHDGTSLSDEDRLRLENNLAIVQVNYSNWVRHFLSPLGGSESSREWVDADR